MAASGFGKSCFISQIVFQIKPFLCGPLISPSLFAGFWHHCFPHYISFNTFSTFIYVTASHSKFPSVFSWPLISRLLSVVISSSAWRLWFPAVPEAPLHHWPRAHLKSGHQEIFTHVKSSTHGANAHLLNMPRDQSMSMGRFHKRMKACEGKHTLADLFGGQQSMMPCEWTTEYKSQLTTGDVAEHLQTPAIEVFLIHKTTFWTCIDSWCFVY